MSYSILLAFAYHEPEVGKISLRRKVKRDRIIQDTGSGGAWPVSSDRTTWVLGAWEIYKVTGDEAWLDEIYPIIRNTLEDDYKTIYDENTGLYSGESSFLDWREQTYPKWMSNMDIYVSQNLGTCVVHYQAHKILAQIAKMKNEPFEVYEERAQKIKDGINKYLWMEDKGYYAQFLYGRPYLNVSDRYEALGEALAILFDVADADQSQSIVSKSPVTEYGATCIYPQIPAIPPYHNNGIWPFVQSYWNLAAAKAGNEKVLNHGLASVYRAAGLFLTNYENMVAETGDFLGTEINSHRMLWSMAGNLAMVHRVFMGMSFEVDGLSLNPVIPKVYGGTRNLSNFKYRNSVLDITVKGYGNQITSVAIDGETVEKAFIPADLEGNHTIEITMANNDFSGDAINLVQNKFTLPNPLVALEDGSLKWEAIEGATAYKIYANGQFVEQVSTNEYTVNPSNLTSYKVSAVDQEGLESFTSEPIWTGSSEIKLEVEDYKKASGLPYTNYSGNGFVEISNTANRTIEIPVDISKAGKYLLDISYSNGSGPWNTDNKCAIRSLSVNNSFIGTIIFPQRGTDEWSDWGKSNSRVVNLNEGLNSVKISFENWNENMNVDVNTAMLDYVRLIPMD